MSSEERRVLAVVGFAALCCFPQRALALPAPSLGNAASFAVLGGSSVTNSGPTVVTGNLGVSPGSTITGFPKGSVQLGDTFKNDALAKLAQHDAGIAYTQLGVGTCTPLPSPIGSPPPGVYCVSSPFQLTGALTLDAAGNHDAVWIFRMTDTFTIASGSCVLAINSAQPGNVFWQVGTSATLGARSALVGNVLAHDNITLNSGANVFGRLLALTGTVTLDTNNVLLCTSCNAINLIPSVLPDGEVGKPYTQTIITASGGTDPYNFKVISGAPPHNLSLTTKGALSGTPSEFGTFQFTVAATDSQGCSGEREYTIVIPCPNIVVTNPKTTTGTSCTEFSQRFTQTCGSSATIFKTDSTLPLGLTLEQDGLLHGTPVQTGPFPIVVTASDSNKSPGTGATYLLKLTCPEIVVTNPVISTGTAGTPFNQTARRLRSPSGVFFTRSGSLCATTFSLESGKLPNGMTLAANGHLSGTPTQIGTFNIKVRATDRSGCTGIGPTYTLIIGCQTIIVRNPINTFGTVGVPFSETFTQRGAIGSVTFTETGILPTGLPTPAGSTLPAGVLSGTPLLPGPFPIIVTVTDANQCTGTSPVYPLFIKPVPPCVLTLSPITLPSATLNLPYSQTITASGGTGSYTFSVTTGTIPPPAGLTFMQTTPTTAVISGTPTALGSFFFCVTVTDTSAPPCAPATQCYTIDVLPPVAGGPTLSGWGMLLLSALLAGVGLVMIRKGGG